MSRILIVDDERDFRESLAEALRQASHSVEECRDGLEALELLGHHRFDVVISDLRMPGGSGLAFLKEAEDRMRGVIRIVLTAMGTAEHELESKKAGIDCFLTKPVNIKGLIKKIEFLVSSKVHQRQESPHRS